MKWIGDAGERTAERYLKKQKYHILERNYRTRFGEIDLIAEKGEYLVFVEVKYRKNDASGQPAEYVTHTKRQRLIRAAKQYMKEHSTDQPVRFDVVSVLGELKSPKVELIQNAFSATDV